VARSEETTSVNSSSGLGPIPTLDGRGANANGPESTLTYCTVEFLAVVPLDLPNGIWCGLRGVRHPGSEPADDPHPRGCRRGRGASDFGADEGCTGRLQSKRRPAGAARPECREIRPAICHNILEFSARVLAT